MILGKRLVILSSSCLKQIREENLVVVEYTHASTESVLHIAGKEGNLVVMGIGRDRRTNLGAVSRDLESPRCESLVERVGRVSLRHVEVAEHNEVSRKAGLACRLPIRPSCDGKGLQRAPLDVLLLVASEIEMYGSEQDCELPSLERSEVRVPVEARECLRDARERNRCVVPRRERDLTDFFQQSEFGAVVEEGETLVVAGAIGHDESPRPSQLVVDVRQIAVVPVSLLHGERIEPPDDLGDQLSVVPGSLLDAEVRDVPRGDGQPVRRLRRDAARELVLP